MTSKIEKIPFVLIKLNGICYYSMNIFCTIIYICPYG